MTKSMTNLLGWRHWWKETIPPGLCVSLLIMIARIFGVFQEYEWQAFDRLLRYRPLEDPSDRLVIVGIDEQDLKTIGGFPVPDGTLAQAIENLQVAEPRVIGIDLFRDLTASPDREALSDVFQTYDNIVGIDVALNADESLNVLPPPELPAERVGFADVLIDTDGKLRRLPLASRTWEGTLRYSFAFTLARQYLEKDGYSVYHGQPHHSPLRHRQSDPSLTYPRALPNGASGPKPHSSDPIVFTPPAHSTRRSSSAHLTSLKPNTGGYVGTDAYGHQLLLNFCTHPDCYPVLSLRDVLEQRFDPEQVRDRIVLIGMTAPSIKDTFVTAAVKQTLFSQYLPPAETTNRSIYGIELHAHALHHLLGLVLDRRTAWRSLPELLDYGWILAWSLGGVSIGLVVRSPWLTFIGIGGLTLLLCVSCYGLILLGWWLPLVPTALSLVAAGLTTAFFDRDLRLLSEQRRLTIEQTFEAVHNGPLQSLAVMSRDVKAGTASPQALADQLDGLNQELRGLYVKMEDAAIGGSDRLYLGNNLVLDVSHPLPELLDQIFTHTLERPFPGFETLRFCITPDFSPLANCVLSPSLKRGICLFFEEALCNVGKHGLNTTRLEITCTASSTEYNLLISDNSPVVSTGDYIPFSFGQGTKQAESLAQNLNGKFERLPNKKKGTKCKLTWPISYKPSFHWLQDITLSLHKLKSRYHRKH